MINVARERMAAHASTELAKAGPPMTRTVISASLLAATWIIAKPAVAQPPPAVDVVIRETPPPQKLLTVEWNPIALAIGKLSANVLFVPIDHHALILSPFYAWATTAPIYVFANDGTATQLPEQKFSGFGGEIGYRYYTGLAGPRGFFFGPSLVLASMQATAANGDTTSFFDYGLAVDAGYQVLVADVVSLSLGGGVQYLATSQSIPPQQFPANVYANSGLRPRLLASIGWAF